LLDKAVSFFVAKPLYCSFCHSIDLLSQIFHNNTKPKAATLAKEAILQSKADLQM